MYYLKFFLIPLLLALLPGKPAGNATRWVISRACSLKVEGSTNVNSFSCIITNSFRPDTVTLGRSGSSELTSISGGMILNVEDFNCNNPIMTGDLRKTLKAKEFPQMKVGVLSLSRYPDMRLKTYPLNGLVSIQLAGVTKKFNVVFLVLPSGTNALMLKGVREIKFSDFNIVPPRKIGGMIQTSDKLMAEFNLALHLLKD
ncbi:MAG: YceI family protein [Bacteroidota bacterium]